MGEESMGVETPPVPPTNEVEKGNETEPTKTLPPGTGGEGTSGTDSQGTSDGMTRKPGHCMPKSKAMPKLTI